MMSEAEITAFIQLTNNKIDLRFPDRKNDAMAGTADNTRRGKLIKKHKPGSASHHRIATLVTGCSS